MIIEIEKGIYAVDHDIEVLLETASKEAEKMLYTTMLRTGGAYSMELTEEVKTTAINSGILSGEDIAKLNSAPMGFYIQVYNCMFEEHSKAEKAAIFNHELAHIKLGHLTVSEELRVLLAQGEAIVIDNVDYELAADSFGAFKTSKKTMASAVSKCLRATAKLIAELSLKKKGVSLDRQDLYDSFMETDSIRARMKALNS